MHYYQFNIADYRKDTAHLTPIEHYIYRTLIDWYYLDEKIIPKETQSVMRRLRLATEEEAQLLKNVLSDFFEEEIDGWRHKRINADIEDFHCKCIKNKENGKKGGRPKSTPEPEKTRSVILGNQIESESNPNQEPLTKEPLKTFKEKIIKKEIDPELKKLLHDVDDQVIKDFSILRKQKKAPVTESAVNGLRREAGIAGIDLQTALIACCQNGWQGFKAEWYQKAQAPPAYQTKQHLASVAARSIFGNEAQEKVIDGEVIEHGSIAKQLG